MYTSVSTYVHCIRPLLLSRCPTDPRLEKAPKSRMANGLISTGVGVGRRHHSLSSLPFFLIPTAVASLLSPSCYSIIGGLIGRGREEGKKGSLLVGPPPPGKRERREGDSESNSGTTRRRWRRRRRSTVGRSVPRFPSGRKRRRRSLMISLSATVRQEEEEEERPLYPTRKEEYSPH